MVKMGHTSIAVSPSSIQRNAEYLLPLFSFNHFSLALLRQYEETDKRGSM
jgi:hypothetical protein